MNVQRDGFQTSWAVGSPWTLERETRRGGDATTKNWEIGGQTLNRLGPEHEYTYIQLGDRYQLLSHRQCAHGPSVSCRIDHEHNNCDDLNYLNRDYEGKNKICSTADLVRVNIHARNNILRVILESAQNSKFKSFLL